MPKVFDTGNEAVPEQRVPIDHPIRDLLVFFDERYREHTGGTKYPFVGGRDAKVIDGLRALYTDEELRTFMAAFFEIPDEFIVQSGHSLQVFRGCLPKIIRFVSRAQPWVCPHVEACSHRAMCDHKTAMPQKYPRRAEAT